MAVITVLQEWPEEETFESGFAGAHFVCLVLERDCRVTTFDAGDEKDILVLGVKEKRWA